MINKLKKKFIILATVSMFLLMSVLVLIMNIVNYSSVVTECNSVLNMLSQITVPFVSGQFGIDGEYKKTEDFVPRGMSPEVPYESRYFSAVVLSDGEITESDFSRIISVDVDSAREYIMKAYYSSTDSGFIEQFRYLKIKNTFGTRILFLDCGRKLDSFRAFLQTSIVVGLFGCIAVFIAFLFVSGKIVKPIAESYEKQKRFISDAGHEIKTPLTIINANVDLLEADDEKEELCEIRQQTKRLTELTNNLVFLSKMEEEEHALQKIEIPLSDIIGETANSFKAPALSRNIIFNSNITPNITLLGSQDAMRRLISVLLENAVKYTPDGGIIQLNCSIQKKSVCLTVFNTTSVTVDVRDLPHLFDRFYRTDISRNSQTGGHGIGLSIAKAIVEAHNGTVFAQTQNGSDFMITVLLPLS